MPIPVYRETMKNAMPITDMPVQTRLQWPLSDLGRENHDHVDSTVVESTSSAACRLNFKLRAQIGWVATCSLPGLNQCFAEGVLALLTIEQFKNCIVRQLETIQRSVRPWLGGGHYDSSASKYSVKASKKWVRASWSSASWLRRRFT